MNIRPKINILSSVEIGDIHNKSLLILEKAGIRVDCDNALKIFRRSPFVKTDRNLVYIKPDLVEKSIASAPSSIQIYNKKGEEAFSLGESSNSSVKFGVGVTNPNFQDPVSKKIIPFKREHTRYAAKLGDMLEAYDMVSTPGVPTDVAPKKLDLYNLADMYASTDKPLVILLLEDGIMDKAMKFIKRVHGDPAQHPFIMPYVNPVTPLILNKSTTDKMICSIENGLPLIFSNYGMSGGTSPIDGPGTLTLLNAELLAGLVFSQLIRQGSEIILGSLPASFNMRSMISTYSPQSYLINIACAEMMHHYRIPHCGTSGSGAGWNADINAAGDLWMNHLTSIMSNVGIAPFVGGNFDSKAFSPSLVILSNDIIMKCRRFKDGLTSFDGGSTLEEIINLGPGGDYLTAISTLNSLSDPSMDKERIWPEISLEEWENSGAPDAGVLFSEYALSLYNSISKESDSTFITLREYEEIINSLVTD